MKFTTIIRFIPVAAVLLLTSSGCGARLGAASSVLSGVSCSPTSFSGAGKATCTLTFSNKSGGIRYVTLKSSSSAVKVPSEAGVWTDDISDPFTATVSAVTVPQTVTITATYNDVSTTATLQLGSGTTQTASLSDSASSVAFGNVALNTPTSKTITLTSTGTASVTITAVKASGTNFSVSGGVGTLAPGAQTIITISFDPTTAAADTGSVTITSNTPTLTIALSGTGVSTPPPPTLTIVSCTNATITGAGTDGCQANLSGAATVATAVALSSSSASLTVPASVTVPVGASSASFTATASAVTTATVATITASLAGNTASTTITLEPAVVTAPTLTGITCGASTITGAGTDNCTVTLSAAATSATLVALSSNSTSLTVPSSVTVASGSSTGSFTATAAAVSATTVATITATLGSTSETFPVTLQPASSPGNELWSGILLPTSGTGACNIDPTDQAAKCAIDWTATGIPGAQNGVLPSSTWTQSGASITATGTDQSSQIQTALNNCGGTAAAGHFVQLAAGAFTTNSTVTLPSYCVLRGMGANQTTISATGTGTQQTCEPDAGDGDTQAFCLGSGSPNYTPTKVAISAGATAGSTSLTLASTSGMVAGGYLIVTDTNDPWVTIAGGEGNCTWCTGFDDSGTTARGQIVEIENISGSTVTIAPGLYSAYANSPTVVYFAAAAKYTGIENLSVSGSNHGWGALYGMNMCAYCWASGVGGYYSDNNWLNIAWGYRDQVQFSYFSNSYDHTPGSFDGTVDLFFKTSASLVMSNIMERGHIGTMLEWGAAGNAIVGNYYNPGFDTSGGDILMMTIDYHGSHPQFNLIESNVGAIYEPDEIWGSSSHNTNHRNWWKGTGDVCQPVSGAKATVGCTPLGTWTDAAPATGGWIAFAYSYAENITHYAWYDNFVDDVAGSAQQQGVPAFNGTPEANVAILSWTSGGCGSGCRDVDGPGVTAYNFTFGFGETSDDGSGTGCDGATTSTCHSVDAWETSFLYNTYTFTNTTTNCVAGGSSISCPTADPPSFIFASKPTWWNVAWPSIGSDVTGGAGPGGHTSLTGSNPAMSCYLGTMGGVDGAAGSPLSFNATTCYGTAAIVQ